jgi:hypothetical protein
VTKSLCKGFWSLINGDPESRAFSGAIDAGSVVDGEDGYLVVLDAVDGAEVATSGAMEAFQLGPQRKNLDKDAALRQLGRG